MRPFFCYKSSSINFSDADMTRILTPSVAEYTIEYNGAGSLHIEHPDDNEGKWKAIQCGEIIMAPIMRRGEDFPQPFRIYKVTKTRRNGVPIISADALHVFYDLNYCMTEPLSIAEYTGVTVDWFLNNGLESLTAWTATPIYRSPLHWNSLDPDYFKSAYASFTKSSNIAGNRFFPFAEGHSVTELLVGEGNSLSAMTGGVLFVDKRRFSINDPMEGAIANAFTIAYGLNLEGVSQTIDSSNVVTLLENEMNLSFDSGQYPTGYVMPGVKYSESGYPYSRIAFARFNYGNTEGESAAKQKFVDDSAQYFSERSAPKVTYSIQLTARQVSDEVANIATYEVGDTGTIYDPDLDINTTQMITKKVVDLMTQRVKSVELSSTNNRSFRRTWSNTITSGQSALEKRLNAMG